VSRFLARALAMVAGEADAPAALTPAGPIRVSKRNIGGFVGLGVGVGSENSLPPAGRLPGMLEPAADAWPDGVDYWLTHDAVKLAGILNMGGTARWCPTGGLDMWRADGRYLGFGPHKVAALRAAGLLPASVPDRPP